MYRFAFLAALMVGTASLTPLAAPPVAAGGISSPPPPWRTLPPLPSLPPGTAGRHADIGGARIWFAAWGPRSARTPVLLLHGGFGNSNYYGHLIPVLAAHGYRVIAMDSRGHGRSTRGAAGPGAAAPLSYDLMARDVLGLLDQLTIPKVYIVGWSDGGIIGLDLAMSHPDRLAGLFAFGVNADVSGLKDGAAETPTFGAYLARTAQEYHELSPTPQQWQEFKAAVLNMWETLPAYTRADLASIKVPTTIADGEFDEGIKREHEEYMAQAIPGAHLIILPDVSHFAMLQDPPAFNAAVLHFLGATH